ILEYQESEAGRIYLIDEESDEIVLHAHKGISDEILEKVRRVPLSEPNVTAAMTSKDVFIKEPGCSEEIIEQEKKYGIEKAITIKLQARDKVIGFVNVTLPADHEILEEDALVLESVGKQVGIVIENLRLFNETEKAYEELKSLDRMKDEFLSNVSHELQTPLVSIGGYSEVLNAGALGALNEGQKKAADAIMRNADKLERLINSILYLSIEESGKMKYTFKPLQIADVIEHSVLDMLPQIKNNNLGIKKQVPDNLSLIKGDEKKLMQVISNLIDNAIKFTPSGDITISAHEDDDKLHIAVSDTGIGMPQEETNNLFKRFYQVDASTTRKYGGTGLGLYISKLIAEAHNGKIWAESEKGVGTTIHVTLPK
ncbi:MAG: GHKL domain-containing protein, partial [Methanosarcinaceae archaeon]|nr:GHKL domain-containing protein [Methanosarcinaceae archaeon]